MTRTRPRLAWSAAAAAVLLALAWWVWSSRAQPAPPQGPGDARVPVLVAPVREVEDDEQVQALGTALARRAATLQPAVAGQVATLHFRPGQRVRAGAVLMRLDDRRERLDVEMAEARLAQARRQAARLAGTAGTGAVPESVIDEARAIERSAEIALALARQALAERALHAPFDGVVGLAEVDPGDRVTPDSVITELHDRRRLRVGFDLPEQHLARVVPGHAVKASSIAFPERVFEGRIAQIDSRVDPATRTLRLRAELANEDDALRPGMSLQVTLALPSGRQLELPDLALQWGREGGHVWVVRDGRAERVPVRLVRRLEGAVRVDGALQPGEPVVVEGVQRLRPGRAVQVLEPAA